MSHHSQKMVAAVTALAIAISEGKTNKELIFICEILSQLTHTLRTIADLSVTFEVLDTLEDLDDELNDDDEDDDPSRGSTPGGRRGPRR